MTLVNCDLADPRKTVCAVRQLRSGVTSRQAVHLKLFGWFRFSLTVQTVLGRGHCRTAFIFSFCRWAKMGRGAGGGVGGGWGLGWVGGVGVGRHESFGRTEEIKTKCSTAKCSTSGQPEPSVVVGPSAVVADEGVTGSSAVVGGENVTRPSAVVADEGVTGPSAVVADEGVTGPSAVVADEGVTEPVTVG